MHVQLWLMFLHKETFVHTVNPIHWLLGSRVWPPFPLFYEDLPCMKYCLELETRL